MKIAPRALVQTSCPGLVVAAGTFGLAQVARGAGDYRLSAGDKIRTTIVGRSRDREYYRGGLHRLYLKGPYRPRVGPGYDRRRRRVDACEPVPIKADTARPAHQCGGHFTQGVLHPGEVENRGSYPHMPGLTVAQAVAIAGGYTHRASRSRITVQRRGASEEKASEDTLLRPGDVIRVSVVR